MPYPHQLIALSFSLMVSTQAIATTWVVRPDGSGDAPTIQAAVDSATTGDVIELADGVFVGPGNRDVQITGKSIRLISQSGNAMSCEIDCQGTSSNPHRAFVLAGGGGAACVFENLTIRGGYVLGSIDQRGGAILATNTTFQLLACVIRGNTARSGAGIYFPLSIPARVVEHIRLLDTRSS